MDFIYIGDEKIDIRGLHDMVFSLFFTTTERFPDLPRKYELKAVIDRMREITFQAGDVQ